MDHDDLKNQMLSTQVTGTLHFFPRHKYLIIGIIFFFHVSKIFWVYPFGASQSCGCKGQLKFGGDFI